MNQHVKKLRVCARSKRWWSPKLSEARSLFKAARRRFQRKQLSNESYKIEHNAYYRMIRRARNQCFDRWIQGDEKIYEPLPNIPSPEEEVHHRRRRGEDNKKCWVAFHYTKEWQQR